MAELDAALEAFHAGDAAALERLLRADPTLVRARVSSVTGHYCGYLHQATRLHHVAGNPTLRPLPRTRRSSRACASTSAPRSTP